ncbi:MAG: OmpH family outer membrane protein [Altererythrobacter sp.]|nr:OmpH family outer membrane protein [Altererythrobacter sp.]
MITRYILSMSLLLAAAPALAQTVGGARPAAQPAPAAEPLGGPVVAGVCLLSREAIFANAAVGRAATARLQELTRAAQAEVDAQRQPIEADARALEDQRASLSADQFRQRQDALAQRLQTVQQQASHVSREIEATRTRALERISNEAQPVIVSAYRAKNCGLLFDRSAALGGNFANDLTADVVRGLDARLQTITFERERLPQEPAAPASAPR